MDPTSPWCSSSNVTCVSDVLRVDLDRQNLSNECFGVGDKNACEFSTRNTLSNSTAEKHPRLNVYVLLQILSCAFCVFLKHAFSRQYMVHNALAMQHFVVMLLCHVAIGHVFLKTNWSHRAEWLAGCRTEGLRVHCR